MIIIHIEASRLVIIVSTYKYLTSFGGSFKTYEISTICLLAVYSVYTVILGLLVNLIYNKI